MLGGYKLKAIIGGYEAVQPDRVTKKALKRVPFGFRFN